jgi:hypothetical protein
MAKENPPPGWSRPRVGNRFRACQFLFVSASNTIASPPPGGGDANIHDGRDRYETLPGLFT